MSEIYVIAEAGVNHNGDLARALEMVDAAAAAGANAVKFQTFDPSALVIADAPQAEYQIRNDADHGSQRAMLDRLALSNEDHLQLLAHCRQCGIDFLSSPFDPVSAHFLLDELKLPRIKLGSGELTNGPLLLQIARAGRAIILSTGMATLKEVGEALEVIAFGLLHADSPPSRAAFAGMLEDEKALARLKERVTLLHCTTEYPCPIDQVNLRAMDTLHHQFDLPVGYSDHTEGGHVALLAAARGARIIEKHFTLDRNLPGPDHRASLEPEALRHMIEGIRALELVLGHAEKQPAPAESANAAVVRKSLVAARPIGAGEAFCEDNLAVKRPGSGRSPMDYWALLGQTASRDYVEDELIQ